MAARFLDARAAIQVKDSTELGAVWQRLLREPEHAAQMGNKALELVERSRGATARVLERIERIIQHEDWGGR